MVHLDSFGTIFNTLYSSLQELLPPALLQELLDNAGQRLGLEALTRYRVAEKQSAAITSKNYVRAMVDGAIWPTKPITVRRNLIRFSVDGAPVLKGSESFTPILAGFFRSAALDQFGQSSVTISGGLKGRRFIVTVRWVAQKSKRSKGYDTRRL